MKSIEFMYWLQGYFEVCDCKQLDLENVQIIKNHLKMVEITDKRTILPFCSWLQGFFVAIEDNAPTVKQTQNIKNKLNGIFEHVVDAKLSQSPIMERDSRSVMVNC